VRRAAGKVACSRWTWVNWAWILSPAPATSGCSALMVQDSFQGKNELLASFRPGPFYWQGIEDMNDYSELVFENPKAASGARGWDAAETASYFNLAGWDASLRFLEQVGVATVAAHNRARTPEQTKEFYERLRKAKVFASLREGNIRVSTHLYNTEQDIDKLVEVIAR
jgi:cysteine desulfurase/selenocysteine lyase